MTLDLKESHWQCDPTGDTTHTGATGVVVVQHHRCAECTPTIHHQCIDDGWMGCAS